MTERPDNHDLVKIENEQNDNKDNKDSNILTKRKRYLILQYAQGKYDYNKLVDRFMST